MPPGWKDLNDFIFTPEGGVGNGGNLIQGVASAGVSVAAATAGAESAVGVPVVTVTSMSVDPNGSIFTPEGGGGNGGNLTGMPTCALVAAAPADAEFALGLSVGTVASMGVDMVVCDSGKGRGRRQGGL